MLEGSLFELVLPFFLILAIVYGTLEFTSVFKNKAVMVIISLIIAFFAITSPLLISLIWQIFPYAAIFFIVAFFLGFLFSFLKKAERDWPLIAIVCGLILLILARFGFSMTEFFQYFPVSYSNFLLVFGLVMLIAIFYAAYRHT